MIVTKPIDLDRLRRELVAAGVAVNTLVSYRDTNNREVVMATDNDGRWVELPVGAQVIVNAHAYTPPVPVDYGADAATPDAMAGAVNSLRGFMNNPNPPPALVTQAIKNIGAIVLGLAQRQGVR